MITTRGSTSPPTPLRALSDEDRALVAAHVDELRAADLTDVPTDTADLVRGILELHDRNERAAAQPDTDQQLLADWKLYVAHEICHVWVVFHYDRGTLADVLPEADDIEPWTNEQWAAYYGSLDAHIDRTCKRSRRYAHRRLTAERPAGRPRARARRQRVGARRAAGIRAGQDPGDGDPPPQIATRRRLLGWAAMSSQQHNIPPSGDVERLGRHARRYGTDLIYETAQADGCDVLTLASLARRLRHETERRDERPRWKLTQDQARQLALGLLEAGEPDKSIPRGRGHRPHDPARTSPARSPQRQEPRQPASQSGGSVRIRTGPGFPSTAPERAAGGAAA